MTKLVLTSDINLMGVTDPNVPFMHLADEFRADDYVFSNLECCLFDPPLDRDGKPTRTGYFAPASASGEALRLGGIRARQQCQLRHQANPQLHRAAR